jgi:hypothetical protein
LVSKGEEAAEMGFPLATISASLFASGEGRNKKRICGGNILVKQSNTYDRYCSARKKRFGPPQHASRKRRKTAAREKDASAAKLYF